MSILLNNRTRLLIQGLGNEGQNQIRRSLDYGTRVVAGVHPGFRGGDSFSHGNHSFPVFATVAEAVEQTQANCTIIYVPAPGAADAILENIAAEVPLIVCITEGVPVHDMIRVRTGVGRLEEPADWTELSGDHPAGIQLPCRNPPARRVHGRQRRRRLPLGNAGL